jgi:hypothetical protein
MLKFTALKILKNLFKWRVQTDILLLRKQALNSTFEDE